MMRRLKPRRRLDALPNQPRAHRQRIIRWIYLASVAALALWLGDLFFGGYFYLRSEGMVLGQPAVIAAEFPVTVRELRVREGQRVTAGEVAVVVSSQTVTENLARLAADYAAQEVRLGELRIRSQTVDAVVGFAEDRQKIASAARQEMESLLTRGYLSLDKRTAAVESDFRSRQDAESLRAEKRTVESEIATLGAALYNAETALKDLRQLYGSGRMLAPIDGIVGRIAAEHGAVVRVGEPIIELYGDERFILAYIPTGALYDVAVGDAVRVTAGLRSYGGVITRVEPIAAALPREFQRAFTPVQRQQVIRVEFAPDETPPPLFTKIKLRPVHTVESWIHRFSRRLDDVAAAVSRGRAWLGV